MPDSTDLLLIDVEGQTRSYALSGPGTPARICARALLDTPQVIHKLNHPAGRLAILGGLHRHRKRPNFHASVLAHTLGGPVEDLRGSILFAGLTPNDELTALPPGIRAIAKDTFTPPATPQSTPIPGIN
uniref:Uncharacterized protein n=1 Tax=Streptomyces sp. NBC_00003 TaxID=2903608 RepID=A0AAU2V712_9ACTN